MTTWRLIYSIVAIGCVVLAVYTDQLVGFAFGFLAGQIAEGLRGD